MGGTIAESGISTIGIAESIDPGNFETDETALVLLDSLSEPAGAGVGGTADDVDVDYGDDRFTPSEGFVGIEDTLGRIAFGVTS